MPAPGAHFLFLSAARACCFFSICLRTPASSTRLVGALSSTSAFGREKLGAVIGAVMALPVPGRDVLVCNAGGLSPQAIRLQGGLAHPFH